MTIKLTHKKKTVTRRELWLSRRVTGLACAALSARTPTGRSAASLPRSSVLLALATSIVALVAASAASARTYPMYQCAPGIAAVSPGWSVYGINTDASTVLSNTCSAGGAIGDYVFSNEQAGAVTESANKGSEVGLQIDVPGSVPDVTIQSIAAEVIDSSVTGDDAYMGFTSAGQQLPGGVELPYGGSDYTASDSWTLPQGARDFETHVTCTTDDSSPTCYFADSISVPALSDITLTLVDNTPPAITSVSGALATTAADKATVTGLQAFGFAASDVDSGVQSATLTLTPQGGGTPYTHTFDFSAQCLYDSWNACPLNQTVSGFAVDTSALKDDTYAVDLTVTDAAGNIASDTLGKILTDNAPVNASPPSIEANVPQATVGTQLSATNGAWEAPTGAGAITYTGQWLTCDAASENCRPVSGATTAAYTITAADAGSALRYQVTAKNTAGSATAVSPASAVVPNTQQNSAPPGPGGPLPGPEAGPGSPGTALPGPGGTQTLTQTLGAANGSNANEAAYISLGVTSTINRSYNESGVTVTGRLLDPAGHPIGGATLEVLQRVATAGAPMVKIGLAYTAADGSFTVRIPKGPSRLIRLAYRAFTGEVNYAYTRDITQHVSTSITLQVTPRSIAPHEKVKLTGRVLGGYIGSLPPVVELEVKYLGEWRLLHSVRCHSNGKFEAHYEFLGATGLFPFRARVRASTGRPYTPGYSTTYAVLSE